MVAGSRGQSSMGVNGVGQDADGHSWTHEDVAGG
jgi:hypothetical protein